MRTKHYTPVLALVALTTLLALTFSTNAVAQSCPIQVAGDVNVDGALTSADVIVLVNYIFKGTGELLPCAASGDVNCNGAVTSADIIFMVGHVFKGGAPPCDICNTAGSMYDEFGC